MPFPHLSRSLFFIWASALALVIAPLGWAQSYTIVNLGNFGGSSDSTGGLPQAYATGINNSGQVVGSAYTTAHVGHGFLYQNGTLTDLTTTYGANIGQPKDISNAGQITGTLYNATGSFIIGPSGTVSTVGTLYANAISETGILVGSDTGYPNRAVRSDHGAQTDLGTFGGVQGVANGINASGNIVGYATNSTGRFIPYLYSGGTLTNLGNLGGNGEGIANDINDAGTIVGYSKNASAYSTAFSYVSGVMTSLGQLNNGRNSVANAINASGQIVGFGVNGPSGHQEAALFQGGSVISLNTLVDPTLAGFSYLTQALDINDLGQIVGYGVPIGGTLSSQQAFLLTPIAPVPEPATTTALAGLFVLGAVLAYRTRRAA